MTTKPVLQIEDDENDVFFMKHAFRKAGVLNPLLAVCDGQEAVDYLAGAGKFANRHQFPMPGVVLLDLNLPRKSGLEILKWIREQPAFHTLPVVVLSSSNRDADIHRAYSTGANAYLVKPPDPDGLLDLVRLIHDFWLRHNQLPPDCTQFTEEEWVSPPQSSVSATVTA
jgi:CheY-like chemotaxis protein